MWSLSLPIKYKERERRRKSGRERYKGDKHGSEGEPQAPPVGSRDTFRSF